MDIQLYDIFKYAVRAMSVCASWCGRGARDLSRVAGRVSCEKSTTGRKNRPRGTSDFPGRFLYT